MHPYRKSPMRAVLRLALIPGAAALLMTACVPGQDSAPADAGVQPANQIPGPAFDAKKLIAQGLAEPAEGKLVRLPDDEMETPRLGKAAASDPVYITFQDPDALARIPDVNSTFVLWPGYIQEYASNHWMYVWMGKAPGLGFYGPNDQTGKHYHIGWDNYCIHPSTYYPGIMVDGICNTNLYSGLNRYHQAMFGYDWLGLYAQNNSGRTKFNMYKIRIKGDVPITFWYKNSAGTWKYWPNIAPGNYSVSQTRDIWEVQIAAATFEENDKYSIDNIQVGTP